MDVSQAASREEQSELELQEAGARTLGGKMEFYGTSPEEQRPINTKMEFQQVP